MRKHLKVVALLFSSTLLLNCGGKEKEEAQQEPKTGLEAIQQFAEKAKELENKEPVDPVDFRKLKALLPEEASGFSRKESSGEKTGMSGFNISKADGTYKKGEDASIDVEILDTGGIAGLALAGFAAWTMMDVDKETETGYEKSVKIDGHKAYEKYNSTAKNGELHLMVGNRYIVNLDGNNVTMEQMKDFLKGINLSELAELK